VHWSDVSADPNSPEALAHRRELLGAAWRPPVTDRADFLVARARGKRVLDVGCVDHSYSSSARTGWLHRAVAGAAADCLGVDVLAEDVEQMRREGYDVMAGDITAPSDDLRARGPFDLVIAGEIIEHLGCPQQLLAATVDLLAPDGELVVTTPNPYAPQPVRNGRRRYASENVDHTCFLFPSGMAEMADRTGLRLVEARTVFPGAARALAVNQHMTRIGLARWRRGQRSADPSARLLRIPFPASWVPPAELAALVVRRASWWLGETAIYVLQRHR